MTFIKLGMLLVAGYIAVDDAEVFITTEAKLKLLTVGMAGVNTQVTCLTHTCRSSNHD